MVALRGNRPGEFDNVVMTLLFDLVKQAVVNSTRLSDGGRLQGMVGGVRRPTSHRVPRIGW